MSDDGKQSADDGRLLIDAREAARRLGISERLLWEHTTPRGGVPCVRVGRRCLYSPQALAAWVERREVPANS